MTLSPWRNVVFIEQAKGPRGGDFFKLKLECGHHAFRAIGFSDGRAGVAGNRKPVLSAPRRVRCHRCSLEGVE